MQIQGLKSLQTAPFGIRDISLHSNEANRQFKVFRCETNLHLTKWLLGRLNVFEQEASGLAAKKSLARVRR